MPLHRRSVLPLLAACLLLVLVIAGAAADAATRVVAAPAASLAPAVSPLPRLSAHALKPGASGTEVTKLQQLLNRAGIKVEVSGRYRYATARAVQHFQLAALLPTSGIAGPKTLARLRAGAGGPARASTSGGVSFGSANVRVRKLGDRMPLTRGMSGGDVRQLQTFLRRAGVRAVPKPSGEFDGHTAAAVKRFEARVTRGVDGVVDAGDIYRLVRMVGDTARPGGDGDPAGVELGSLPLAQGDKATLTADGQAIAPESAPAAVRAIIAAGNRIATKPYIYGGGHGSWNAAGYDCSGSVSYALRGADLLKRPLASYDYFNWGASGAGSWVTIYTNSGHMFMVVAGLRFDTSGHGPAGSRWQRDMRSSSSYVVRHPEGL